MNRREIAAKRRHARRAKQIRPASAGLAIVIIAVLVYLFWPASTANHTVAPKTDKDIKFAAGVAPSEQQAIAEALGSRGISGSGLTASVKTNLTADPNLATISAYVPVENYYSTRLAVDQSDLANLSLFVPKDTDKTIIQGLATALKLSPDDFQKLDGPLVKISDNSVAFVPASDLTYKVRLLKLNDRYYLDDFDDGAVFRQASFSGRDTDKLKNLQIAKLPAKKNTLKVNMTGVTALTRKYEVRVKRGVKPTFFSAKIAPFLKDADIVHTSNEISFDDHCHLVTVGLNFCAPPSTIDTLKSAGINLIELTGNHNNNFGAADNAATIKEYHKLGWHTFGGGLNAKQAAKPYVANMKGSKVAFFGYNYADSPMDGAIATSTRAGANSFSFSKIKADIAKAKQNGDFVIVDVQFFECYSYPAYHTEIPLCDQPIAKQESTFRKIIDLGADLVIGTQAHQPQTYEIYKGKEIFYGLGNLFFDQIEWPGTERGIILTHYFYKNKLLQTKLTPTIYGESLQVHQMTNQKNIDYFFNRLKKARQLAGLNTTIDQ